MPRVLMHPLGNDPRDNSFVHSLATALREGGVEVAPFTWRTALLGRYDALHVHWPEHLTAHPRRVPAAIKATLLVLAAARCRLRGRPVVGTVHNLRPHEAVGRFRRSAIRLWYRLCTDRVYLADWAARAAPLGPGIHVPHHAYDIGRGSVSPATRTGLLLFGFLRRYKNLERVIEVAADLPDECFSIVGKPVPAEYGDELATASAHLDTVRITPEALEFDALVQLVASAEIALLPYPDLYSSGAALLALQAGTPIIVVRSASTEELQREFGGAWVRLLPSSWSAAELAGELTALRAAPRPTTSPDLRNRDVRAVAEAYARRYRRAV